MSSFFQEFSLVSCSYASVVKNCFFISRNRLRTAGEEGLALGGDIWPVLLLCVQRYSMKICEITLHPSFYTRLLEVGEKKKPFLSQLLYG